MTTNHFLDDARRTISLIHNWEGEAWGQLSTALAAQRSICWVGEGSSRLLPYGMARDCARQWGLVGSITGCGGRGLQANDATRYRIVACSNSGNTLEVVEALRPLPRQELLAVLGVKGGALDKMVGSATYILDEPEQAVAATVSVVGQTLIAVQALAEHCGQWLPRRELADAVEQVLDAPAPEVPADIERIWWLGNDNGLAEELMLKCGETAGIVGIACGRGIGMHGIHEVLGPHDLVVAIDQTSRDRGDLRARIGATGAHVRCWDCHDDADWRLPDVGPWNPIVHLAAGWRLLDVVARARGRDPAYPERVEKVGNPLG